MLRLLGILPALTSGLALLLLGALATANDRQERGPAVRASGTSPERAKDLCKAESKPPRAASLGNVKDGVGYVDVVVLDEAELDIPGFDIWVDGRKIADGAPPLRALRLGNGEHKIEVKNDQIGDGCATVEIKNGDVTKVAFQFFRLREKVTPLKQIVLERKYYGAIVILNLLEETEAFVGPAPREERRPSDFDPRVSRGGGSVKISNMAVGCYEVDVRRKDLGDLDCGSAGCRRLVQVQDGETAKVIFPWDKDVVKTGNPGAGVQKAPGCP
jgi:hypothetical protein